MNKEGWFQCQTCGFLHRAEAIFELEELFIEMPCSCCKEDTSHLWVGEENSEIYQYYNINIDPRYYNYKKQND